MTDKGATRDNQIFKNSVFSILQVIVTSLGLFLLFKFILGELGADQLGVWSLVLSSASLTGIANLGLSGSVVKFVAKYAAYNNHERVSNIIQTTIITVGTISALLLIFVYLFSELLLAWVLDGEYSAVAVEILPYAIFSVWLSVLSRIIMGGIDGYQRIDLRSLLVIVGMISYVGMAYTLIGPFKLLGLAYAQIIQHLVVIIIGYILLRFFTENHLPLLPFRWNGPVFWEMLNYGINFQLISIVTMLYEPTLKYLLALYGGVAFVGFYELASRMILQFRGLIVTANNVLVPAIADMTERDPGKVKHLYNRAISLTALLSFPLYVMLILLLPLISIIWIGDLNLFFIQASILVIVGWYFNTLASTSYYAFLGNGQLKWATIGHVVIGVLNLGLGAFLGRTVGLYGPIWGWTLSLIIGSVIIIYAYHKEESISFEVFLGRDNLILTVLGIISIGIAYFAFQVEPSINPSNYLTRTLFAVPISGIILLVGMWQNSTRSWIISYMTQRLRAFST